MRIGSLINKLLDKSGYALIAKAKPFNLEKFVAAQDIASMRCRHDNFKDQRGLTLGSYTLEPEDIAVLLTPDKFSGKRILEVGPKTGAHSLWIDRNLSPSFFALFDLARVKQDVNQDYLDQLKSSHEIIYDDILSSDKLHDLGAFDIVFCLGVLYHTVQPFKLLYRLREAMAPGATLVLQTSVSDFSESVLDLRWHAKRTGNYLLPSSAAVLTMLAMSGFNHIDIWVNYRVTGSSLLVTCTRDEPLPLSYSGRPFGA